MDFDFVFKYIDSTDISVVMCNFYIQESKVEVITDILSIKHRNKTD